MSAACMCICVKCVCVEGGVGVCVYVLQVRRRSPLHSKYRLEDNLWTKEINDGSSMASTKTC